MSAKVDQGLLKELEGQFSLAPTSWLPVGQKHIRCQSHTDEVHVMCSVSRPFHTISKFTAL